MTTSNRVLLTDPRNPRGGDVELDPTTGILYDLNGAELTKLKSTTTRHGKMVAAALSDRFRRQMLASIATANPGLAQETARLMSEQSGHLVKMDLGVADVHIPAALPSFSTGYRPEAPMADVIAPVLYVDAEVGKYWQGNIDDAFEGVMPDGGAGNAVVAEISPRIANTPFQTYERAVAGHVPTQVGAAADASLRLALRTSKRIFDALTINREVRVRNLIIASGSWDTALIRTLDSTTKWNGGTASDPIRDLFAMAEVSAAEGTGILMGADLFHQFVQNAAVKAYYQFKSGTNAIPNAEQLASAFGLPPIYIAKMKWKNPATGVREYIWKGQCILFRHPDEMPPMGGTDIATALTLRWRLPTVPDGSVVDGFVVREFFDPARGSMGGTTMVVLHNDAEVMVSPYVGGLLVGGIA